MCAKKIKSPYCPSKEYLIPLLTHHQKQLSLLEIQRVDPMSPPIGLLYLGR